MPTKKQTTRKTLEMYRVAGRIDPEIGQEFDEFVSETGMKQYKAIEKAFRELVERHKATKAANLTQSGQLTN